ncbi:MAG: hypothetical protein DRQ88_12195 [Epsilonproteobacteria bacterium]|nr:MAG: hypothetical protein DRQ89_11865 [Campylobacterota bacterium]RLA63603.1 MAG: hypothetical protein DRQ88_12195 [Campylobacterota bacterium]
MKKRYKNYLIGLLLAMPALWITSNAQTGGAGEAITGIIDMVSGIAEQGIDANHQVNMEYAQALMQQKMVGQMGPQPVAPSAIPMFPNCPIPAEPNIQAQMCQNLSDPNSLMMAQNVKQMVSQYESFYDQYSSATPSAGAPVGLQCIEQSIKKLTQDLQGKSNYIQGLIDQIKKNQQFFAEEIMTIRENMETSYNEINGGGKDLDEAGKDFTSYFPGCRGIIPSDALTNPAGGLRGIKSSMDNNGIRPAAQNFLTNRIVFQKEIDDLGERIQSDMNDVGVDTFFAGGATQSKWFRGGLTQFGGIQQVLAERQKATDIRRARIIKDLAKVGYTPPSFDQNFNAQFGEFAKGATVFFKKSYIDNCVLGGNEKVQRLGLSIDNLMKNIRHKSFGKSGFAVDTYRGNLKAILNSSDFVDEKIQRIKNLDKKFGRGEYEIFYKNTSGTATKQSISEYFISTLQACDKQYAAGGPLTKDNPGGISYKQKVENAQRSINELNLMESTYVSDTVAAIKDKLLNCSGSVYKEGSCTPETMSPGSPDFCLKNGNICAERTQNCFIQADVLIKDRTNKIKINANIYNKKIEELVLSQEAQLKQLNAQIGNDVNALKAVFPGAAFQAPADLVIPLPAPIDSSFGVKLRGGGSMTFLNSFPEQLTKLKMAFEDQANKALEEAGDYLNRQAESINDARNKLQEISDQCDEAMADFQKSYSEMAKKQAEEQGEAASKKGEFCLKYNRLKRTNPLAGCEGSNSPAKLYDDAIKVASFLDSTIIDSLGEYEKLCAEAQNQAQIGTVESPVPAFIRLCDAAKDNWNKVLDFQQIKILRDISNPEEKKQALKYLSGEKDKDEDILDSPTASIAPRLFKQLTNLKLLRDQKGENVNDLIQELNGKALTKKEIKLNEVKDRFKDIKTELGNDFKFKNFKNKLAKIEKNLTPKNVEKARKDLDALLGKESELLKEVGEKNQENLKAQFADLKNLKEEIAKGELAKLPEPGPEGVGTDNKDRFSKNKDDANLCLSLKNTKIADAVSNCKDRASFKKCFNEEIEDTKNDIESGSIHDVVDQKLADISGFESARTIAQRWVAVGEDAQGACDAQDKKPRVEKQKDKTGEKSTEDLIRSIFGRDI